MFRRSFLATTAAVVLMGATALAQRTSYDRSPAADLSRYRTYTHQTGEPIGDPLNDARIVASLDRELGAKGLHRVGPDRPDALLVYRVVFDRSVQITTLGLGPGPVAGRMGSAHAEKVIVATLVVEVVDAVSRQLVWRGVATMDVDQYASPEKRDRNVAKAVAKLLKPYPTAR